MIAVTDELFGTNSSGRWRVINSSIIYTFLAASLSLIMGVSPEKTAVLAAAVAAASYCVQLRRLLERGSEAHKQSGTANYPLAFSMAAYGVLAMFLVLVVSRSPTSVEAEVINWRVAGLARALGDDRGNAGRPLPALASALTEAQRHGQRIQPSMQREINASLVAASKLNLPGYLPASAALIDYQSPKSVSELPDCLQTLPEQLSWYPFGSSPPPDAVPPPDQIKFTRCRLTLDSPTFARQFQPKTQTDGLSLVCENCEITYSGGELPIAKAKGFVNLIFTDCAFKVQLRDDSPNEARGLVSAILAAPDIAHVNYIAAGYVTPTGEVRSRPDH
jgi:hypothetical protein